MKILKNIFFAFSFFLLSASGVYSVLLFAPNITSSAYNESSLSSVYQQNDDNGEKASKKEQAGSQTSSASKADSAASAASEVPTSGSGEAVGKIITKSVLFSAGNTKYNNVSVNNITGLAIDLKTELSKAPQIKFESTSKPQVLIVHTHTTESYMMESRNYYTKNDATRSTDDTKNITAVGKELKDGLQARGIGVIHATEKHDYPEYTNSYSRAAETINKYLKENPTIKVVIDLHRDAMMDSNKNKTALTAEINGKEAAQVMLVSGCQNGTVTGFPNWRENFRLAIRLQQTMEVKYKGLARPILFTSRKYNQHLTNGSLLIECGTDANTLEQAKYSATLLADCLAATLNMLK